MIVLDASALIALLDGADAHHAAVSGVLRETAREPWAVSALTLAEVMTRAAEDEESLLELSETLADLELTVVPLRWEDVEALALLRSRSRLRMPDCCVLLVAQRRGGRILTTDPTLGRRAGELGFDVVEAAESVSRDDG
ncbi:MAG: type II toxin-antitoxin system VapC family toxin [Dermatophilaceae bacterium]|nr:PIN domain-containing protein [Intrasporangiaceae bacterium]